MRISFFGDSLTEGFPGTSYVERIQAQFPHHTIINMGQRNDTVLSLYQRVKRQFPSPPIDIAFLWIGVNDVICRQSLTYRIARSLAPQQKAADVSVFEPAYRQMVKFLAERSLHVVALTLPFKGEDPASACNQLLDHYSQMVTRIVDDSPAELFDIRCHLRSHLNPQSSDYLTSNAMQALIDAVTLRSDPALTRIAHKRGLHLTFDGLHFSPTGADLVAHLIGEYVQQMNIS